ncbi:protein piccolo isoform X2 [Momordica charantia]|uniref:Protein piccolo isoform X2 n=1 Tax=Momordica charantia TaxID=3673 RepID=A0A6J1DMK9_MOMCH|nr:protein piccolo isoform X2 [Momordica charantia]
MPGTIRVSVLEFMDLPSLFPSPISVKVSMGKRHYETSDKGDFSFPLTTLRDDVILIVQDGEGNEISRAGVQAKSIVEKGYWDDHFPLEGGGRVHLQFQFALSEDDRSRIRMMRETALRRKQTERQDRNLKSSGSSLASSFYLNPEFSDSQKCLLQIGDLSGKEAAHQAPSASPENIPDERPVAENTNDIHLDQNQQLSNNADRNEDNPSTVTLLQVDNTKLVESIVTQSPHVNKPSPVVHSEENLFHSQGSELSNSPAKGEDKTLDSAKAPPRGRTPSNVKKVISAFESSLTQDTKPRIKPTIRNTQHVVEKQPSLEVVQSKKATEEQKRKVIEALDGTRLSEDPRQSRKLKGKINQIGGENLSEKDKFHKEYDDNNATNDETYQKLPNTTKWERDTDSERVMDAQQPSTSMDEKPVYDRNSITGESKMQGPARNSQEVNTTGTSAKEVESVSRVKDEKHRSKRSGGWIFPDEGRRLCVTTGGNQMLDMVGGRTSYTFVRKGEMKISMEENRSTSETKANGGKHNYQKMIKPESSDDVKPSEGPLANALKVAIMIGFGTLVLLTRQKKKKK